MRLKIAVSVVRFRPWAPSIQILTGVVASTTSSGFTTSGLFAGGRKAAADVRGTRRAKRHFRCQPPCAGFPDRWRSSTLSDPRLCRLYGLLGFMPLGDTEGDFGEADQFANFGSVDDQVREKHAGQVFAPVRTFVRQDRFAPVGNGNHGRLFHLAPTSDSALSRRTRAPRRRHTERPLSQESEIELC
jgi:hypothetical protein